MLMAMALLLVPATAWASDEGDSDQGNEDPKHHAAKNEQKEPRLRGREGTFIGEVAGRTVGQSDAGTKPYAYPEFSSHHQQFVPSFCSGFFSSDTSRASWNAKLHRKT